MVRGSVQMLLPLDVYFAHQHVCVFSCPLFVFFPAVSRGTRFVSLSPPPPLFAPLLQPQELTLVPLSAVTSTAPWPIATCPAAIFTSTKTETVPALRRLSLLSMCTLLT
eukprot:TRINITY_DN8021_c0_g1_i2.p1 TRINITY_DN8021_c0_g1~~TRINITY_DN8021_c0_g1_i2.p1  ORF type:complete len:109 (-),score=1.91 TRINITY_DN8021_c0_g1_i2:173-499(-)